VITAGRFVLWEPRSTQLVDLTIASASESKSTQLTVRPGPASFKAGTDVLAYYDGAADVI
jgi:hypothetical protein